MVEEITADELHERIEDGDEQQVVDVRPEGQFRNGHFPGAVNVPLPRFAREVDEVEWEGDIVVVCPKGESSLQAARLLESYEGVDEDARVANLTGGYRKWEYGLESDT